MKAKTTMGKTGLSENQEIPMSTFDYTPTTINGPNGPQEIIFGEATPLQRIQCSKLAATAFRLPLSEADCLEHEEQNSWPPLSHNDGWRFWCLFLAADDDARVLATCKTIRRNILVRDNSETREEQAYCLASVITDPQYRQYGLATLLLNYLAEWMDGPGDGIASLLYTSIGDVSYSGRRPNISSSHVSDTTTVLHR